MLVIGDAFEVISMNEKCEKFIFGNEAKFIVMNILESTNFCRDISNPSIKDIIIYLQAKQQKSNYEQYFLIVAQWYWSFEKHKKVQLINDLELLAKKDYAPAARFLGLIYLEPAFENTKKSYEFFKIGYELQFLPCYNQLARFHIRGIAVDKVDRKLGKRIFEEAADLGKQNAYVAYLEALQYARNFTDEELRGAVEFLIKGAKKGVVSAREALECHMPDNRFFQIVVSIVNSDNSYREVIKDVATSLANNGLQSKMRAYKLFELLSETSIPYDILSKGIMGEQLTTAEQVRFVFKILNRNKVQQCVKAKSHSCSSAVVTNGTNLPTVTYASGKDELRRVIEFYPSTDVDISEEVKGMNGPAGKSL